MDNMENNKNKMIGKMKEAAGKMMNSDEMEFKGKLQGMKARMGDKVDDVKDEVMEKANDMMDKMKGNKNNKQY